MRKVAARIDADHEPRGSGLARVVDGGKGRAAIVNLSRVHEPLWRVSMPSLTTQLLRAWRRLEVLQAEMGRDACDTAVDRIVAELRIAVLAFEHTATRSSVNTALIEIAAAELRLRIIEATLDLLGPYAGVEPAAQFELSACSQPASDSVISDYLNALAALAHSVPSRGRLAAYLLSF